MERIRPEQLLSRPVTSDTVSLPLEVYKRQDAQNVPETEKKTDPVSGADAVVSADVAENVVATESADHTSGQTVAQTEALAEAADPAITRCV